MRILFVNEKCGYQGGVEQNVAEAGAILRKRGHACFLLYGSETDKNANKYANIFTQSYYAKQLSFSSQINRRTSSPSNMYDPSIDSIIQEVRPDALYLHKIPTVLPFMKYVGDLPIVRMIHDHDLYCPRRHKYYFFDGNICTHPAGPKCYHDLGFIQKDNTSLLGISFRSIQSMLIERDRNKDIDRLLVGSRYMRDALLCNGFSSSKISILAPAVARDKCKPVDIPSTPHILSVGQLIRGKGIDLFLQACAKIRIPYTATIVGEGNAENKLKELCRNLGLENRVTFAGWVNHDNISSYYDDAKVVVVPSRWPEPFGMNGLEAMIHKRPVVGFNVGGIPDWLDNGKNGILVREQDTDSLAHALEKILSDTSLAMKLGNRGYDIAEEKFSFEKYIIALESHLSGN